MKEDNKELLEDALLAQADRCGPLCRWLLIKAAGEIGDLKADLRANHCGALDFYIRKNHMGDWEVVYD